MSDLNLSPAKGACSLCGCAIGSATARPCVGCERRCTRRCPTCVDARGHLLREFQRHLGCKDDRPCGRCQVWHDEPRQLECPTCHGDRFVLRLPEGRESDG